MSIRDEIKAACRDQKLFFLPPYIKAEGKGREVFVSDGLYSILRDPWDQEGEYREWHEVARSTLDSFSQGRRITVADKPRFKEANSVLARVDPIQQECWDFRCLAPEDGMRILGRFADKDLFVGLVWDYRENLETEKDWTDLVRDAVRAWRGLFKSDPFKRRTVGEYISPPYTLTSKRAAH